MDKARSSKAKAKAKAAAASPPNTNKIVKNLEAEVKNQQAEIAKLKKSGAARRLISRRTRMKPKQLEDAVSARPRSNQSLLNMMRKSRTP